MSAELKWSRLGHGYKLPLQVLFLKVQLLNRATKLVLQPVSLLIQLLHQVFSLMGDRVMMVSLSHMAKKESNAG